MVIACYFFKSIAPFQTQQLVLYYTYCTYRWRYNCIYHITTHIMLHRWTNLFLLDFYDPPPLSLSISLSLSFSLDALLSSHLVPPYLPLSPCRPVLTPPSPWEDGIVLYLDGKQCCLYLPETHYCPVIKSHCIIQRAIPSKFLEGRERAFFSCYKYNWVVLTNISCCVFCTGLQRIINM